MSSTGPMDEVVANLFGEPDEQAAAPAPQERPAGPFAAVALEASVDRSFDYAIPPRFLATIAVGQRVRVPLGKNNRPALGYVVGINAETSFPRIKKLLNIEDPRVLIPPTLMELARWMSRYYVCPLGTVLDSVIPSAVRKKIGLGYVQKVTLAKSREEVQQTLEETKAPKRRAVLARLLQLEPGVAIELVRLAGESGVKPATVRKLAQIGLITIKTEVDLPGLTADMKPSAGNEPDIKLNEDQQKVFDAMKPRLVPAAVTDSSASHDQASPEQGASAGGTPAPLGEVSASAVTPGDGPAGFSVNLILGVTGSGKTEVYLQCIREVVKAGRQAVVLVPEIALTPQTVRRFTARFTNVAVLHSGLTQTERHKYWQQIATGQAQVVVGARSAVFAPVPKLGVIVVDEEHEASYKQDTAPRYHGRDIAIKRAQLENVPVMLGSATPSLEMYERVRKSDEGGRAGAGSDEATKRRSDGGGSEPTGPGFGDVAAAVVLPSVAPLLASSAFPSVASSLRRSVASSYHLLSLPRRVRGLQLPHVELIDMKQENRFRRGVNLIGQRLEHLLRATIEAKHQAILLLNRRGYSNFVYCPSCTNVIQCKYCDATMTYHRSAGPHELSAKNATSAHSGQLHCHYCLAVNPLPDKCPECGKLLSLFGLGTQRVEEEIQKKFPDLKYARVDGDSMRSSKDYEALLGRFARGEVQVLLGTQMIAKGLDYPNVTLVGVISGDTALALPDFRAGERTFQLITQVAGRAGRGDHPGRVVLQTFLPDDPTIQAAIRQDYIGFAKKELVSRKEVGLPPFARMARIVMRDQDEEKLHKQSAVIAALLTEAIEAHAGGAVTMKGPMPCAINRIAGYFRDQVVLSSASSVPLQKVLAAVREKGGLAKGDKVAVDVDPVSLL